MKRININMSKFLEFKVDLDTFIEELKKRLEDNNKNIEELLVQFNFEQKEPLFPSAFEAPIMIDKYDGQAYEEGDEYIYWSN